MKTFARLGLTGIAALSTMTLIAGCAGAEPAAEAQPLSADMEETLTIWYYSEEAALADLEPQIAQFGEIYPNVDFDMVFIPEEQFPNRIISSATTRTGPDLIWYNPQFTQQFADAGAITDFAEEWEAFEDASLFPEAAVQTVEGKPYGIQSYANLNALWINQTMLDELGIEVPTDMDGVEAAMAEVVAAGAGYGMLLPAPPGVPGEWVSRALFSGYGMEGFADYGDPAAAEMVERVAGWVDAGYIDRGTVALAQTEAVNEFLKGETAFYVGGNWQLTLLEGAPFETTVIPVPDGPNAPSSVYLGGQAEAIGAFTVNKELAWEFLSKTFLSREHGEMRLGLGSIPVRADAVSGEIDPKVQAYVDAAQGGIPLPSDTATTIEVGGVWSGLLSGQSSPAEAADQLARLAELAGAQE